MWRSRVIGDKVESMDGRDIFKLCEKHTGICCYTLLMVIIRRRRRRRTNVSLLMKRVDR